MAEFKLADVFDFINGGAWSESEYDVSGIHVVKVTNMVNGDIVRRDDDNYLPESKYEQYVKHKLKEKDIVVATVGSHPTQQGSVVGRTSLISNDISGSFLNQNAVCLRVKRPDLVCPRYFYYITKTVLFKHHIESRARGSANQVRMALGELKKFVHDYPVVSTQKKIASVVATYDGLIENNERRIALLEKMAEEIYREWFVRFRFPGYQAAEFEKGIPKAWREGKLNDIANFVMGQSPKSEFYNDQGDGLPFHQGVGSYGMRFPVNETYCSVSGRMAKEGDILFSVRAPVGRLNIANTKIIIGRGLAAVSHKDKLNSYLYYLLKVAFANEDIIGNGAIFNAVGKDELNRFKILLPDENLVNEFEEKISIIDMQIKVLLESKQGLIKTKEMLLPRLISGKLSVAGLDIRFPPSMHEEVLNTEKSLA